jgi:hypothetical protein
MLMALPEWMIAGIRFHQNCAISDTAIAALAQSVESIVVSMQILNNAGGKYILVLNALDIGL